MILEDITKEFHTLSDDEALKLIMNIRASRRVSKKPVVSKPASNNNSKSKAKQSLSMDAISPAKAASLLQKLRGDK